MIAAVHGPATMHAEFVVLCDLALASETAAFQDNSRFLNGLAPGAQALDRAWELARQIVK